MGSQETAFNDHRDQPEVLHQELATLKTRYEEKIQESKLGKAEKETCLRWIRGGPITMADVQTALRYFDQSEMASARLVAEYERKIKTLADRGVFSKNPLRQRKYIAWFIDLPYEDPKAPMDKRRALVFDKQSRPERYRMLEMWKSLPKAVREKLLTTYENNGLEENLAMLEGLLKRHEVLKERFLRLPKKVQEELKNAFKNIGDFDERETFLNALETERQQLIAAYRGKIRSMQQPDENGLTLFADAPESDRKSSIAKYIDWFENLSLGQMKKMLANSALDDPQRIMYRAQMGQIIKMMPPENATTVRCEFNASDLTARRKMLNQHGYGKDKKHAKDWIKKAVRREAIAGEHQKVRETMETEALLTEAVKERRRAEVMFHTHTAGELQEAAKDHHSFALKRETLMRNQELRSGLKRKFRPRAENKNAILTNVHFLRNSGEEMQTEEFRRVELEAARAEVRTALLPLLLQQSRQEGYSLDKKIFEEELKNVDLESVGHEILKKAA